MLDVISYLNSGYPFLAVKTMEPLRAEKMVRDEIANSDDETAQCVKWDILQQYWVCENVDGQSISTLKETKKPLSVMLEEFCKSMTDSVLIINNINESMSAPIHQVFYNYADMLKARNLAVLFIDSSFSKFKQDFLRMVTFLDLKLPTYEELLEVLTECYNSVIDDDEVEEMTKEELEHVAEQTRGLTIFEAENVYARSISLNGKVLVKDVLAQKATIIKENAALDVYEGEDYSFEDVGGLDKMKYLVSTTIGKKYSKGSLIVGVPGVGKSLFAKGLAGETKRWCVILKFGRLFDKMVGGTEEKVEMTIKTIDSMGKIILMVDEIDKAIGGSMGGGGKVTGNEVAQRAIGTFLTWLQDRKEGDAYIIATCNNVIGMTKSNPEFFRAGRWDFVFFTDLPNEKERDIICGLKSKQYGVKGLLTDIDGWSGAEIEQAYKNAAMLEIPVNDAKEYVLCLKTTASETITEIQEWSKGRALPASVPEKIGKINQKPRKNAKRKIKRS